jgi:hypothetical protein
MGKLLNDCWESFVELRLLEVVPLKELVEVVEGLDADVVEEWDLKVELRVQRVFWGFP